MGERKVLNKYYPPDFDPSKLPRGRRPKDNQLKVRMMMPMSVRCNTCGEWIYKGKKFNSRKEAVAGEEYHGVKIYRLYMRCPRCSSEFTIKTDPKNSDYTAEFGCSRNFEPWRDKEQQIEEAKKQREQEEEGDAMKALENKTMDSKLEMDIIEALDEIRSLNARNAKIDSEQLLEQYKQAYEQIQQKLDVDDEELLNSVVFKNSTDYIKRVAENLEEKTYSSEDEAETEDKLLPIEIPPEESSPKLKRQHPKLNKSALSFVVEDDLEESNSKKQKIEQDNKSSTEPNIEEPKPKSQATNSSFVESTTKKEAPKPKIVPKVVFHKKNSSPPVVPPKPAAKPVSLVDY